MQRVGTHGLWNADGQVPVMQTAMDEVSHHEGNVWRPIISLPREDAERLGYDRVESWQNLIRASLVDIADGYKIKLDNLRWYAAMHVKEKHIHVHMVIFSTDPKEGYLTKQGIKQIKSALVHQVYKDDLLNVYQKQTAHRDRLQENALEVMESLIQKMQIGVTYLNKSKYTNYDDLPLMLSVPDVASVLGISRAGAYELVRSDGFPSLRIGSRIVVPKEKFIDWINANTRA